ncbi:MAG: DsbA family protein, partial [Nitrosopumilus sp.]
FVDLAFLGDDSLPAAAATYYANEQGLYWDYHSYLYSNQRGIDSSWADYSSLKDYAKILRLDDDSFVDCMDSVKYDEAVLQNL